MVKNYHVINEFYLYFYVVVVIVLQLIKCYSVFFYGYLLNLRNYPIQKIGQKCYSRCIIKVAPLF